MTQKCSVMIKNFSLGHTLSYAHPSLSRTPVMHARLCHGRALSLPKILCCDINFPYSGQLCHNIELLCRDITPPYLGQLYRDIKIFCRDIRLLAWLGQLCRDIELLCCDIIPLHLATLYRDIETFCRDRKFLAWLTLSRPKNPLSRQRIVPTKPTMS